MKTNTTCSTTICLRDTHNLTCFAIPTSSDSLPTNSAFAIPVPFRARIPLGAATVVNALWRPAPKSVLVRSGSHRPPAYIKLAQISNTQGRLSSVFGIDSDMYKLTHQGTRTNLCLMSVFL